MRYKIIGWIMLAVIFFVSSESALTIEKNPDHSSSPIVKTKSDNPSNKVQMTDIHDIKDLEKLVYYTPYIYLAVLIVLFIGILLWIYFWTKRKKKKIVAVEAIPAEKKALRLLEELETRGNMDGREYYFMLLAVVRSYIRDRFNIDAPEMTTEEFLPAIKIMKLTELLQRNLRDLVITSDPVKFASQKTDPEKMKKDLMFVKYFIKNTTPLQENV